MRLKIIVASFAAILLSATHAFADDLIYVELGTAESQSDAAEQWQAVQKKQPKLLHGLEFMPREVMHAGRKKLVHIQAGPIEDKRDAQRLCNRLFKAEISCFIVEGLTPTYAKAPAVQPVNEPLPWLSETAPAAREPKNEGGFLTSIFGEDEKPATETKIQVAEAIRVPLSTNENAPATKLVNVQPVQAGISGWLTLDSFTSESEASQFWKKLRASSPSMVVGLRVLIIRTEDDKVALTLGSFANETAANDFCEQVVKPQNESLNCHFGAHAPKAASLAPRKSDEPSQRDVQKDTRLRLTQSRIYWVQVASGESKRDAEESWQEVLSANKDLLEGIRHSITSIDSDYMVRVGPLSTEEEAAELCQTLKKRGMECDVEAGR